LEALLEGDKDLQTVSPILALLPTLLNEILVKVLSNCQIILLSSLNHRSNERKRQG
jgi:hypothetical protein